MSDSGRCNYSSSGGTRAPQRWTIQEPHGEKCRIEAFDPVLFKRGHGMHCGLLIGGCDRKWAHYIHKVGGGSRVWFTTGRRTKFRPEDPPFAIDDATLLVIQEGLERFYLAVLEFASAERARERRKPVPDSQMRMRLAEIGEHLPTAKRL